MARRPNKETPELNVTSFCDIITVTIVALFMVLVVVIDLGMRTPRVRPTPISVPTTNQPIFVECRNNQLYYIDRAELWNVMQRANRDIAALALGGDSEALNQAMTLDVGNRYYRLDNSFLMMGIAALIPRPGVPGVDPPDGKDPRHPFARLIDQLSTNRHYLVYLVRDDSFEAFRRAREFAAVRGFLVGWEYISRDEPLTFEGMFSRIRAE